MTLDIAEFLTVQIGWRTDGLSRKSPIEIRDQVLQRSWCATASAIFPAVRRLIVLLLLCVLPFTAVGKPNKAPAVHSDGRLIARKVSVSPVLRDGPGTGMHNRPALLGQFLGVSLFKRPNYDGLQNDFLDRKYASSVELIVATEDLGTTHFSHRDEQYVIAIIGFITIALFVFGMFWQRAKTLRVQQSLVERFTFERLLSDISSKFINLRAIEIHGNIEQELGRIAEFLKMDHVALFEFSQDNAQMTAMFSWTRAGIPFPTEPLKPETLPWWRDRLLCGEATLASNLAHLPEEASAERKYFLRMGILSIASVPVKFGGEIIGGMSFISKTHRVHWTQDSLNQVKLLGEIFWNALQRQRSIQILLTGQNVLRESEERFRLVANTAPALIWMSGVDKRCTFFNLGWLRFRGRVMEQELGDGWISGVHPDDVEQCLAIYSGSFDARNEFEIEYRLRRFDGEYRWVADYGAPRFGSDGAFCGYIGSCVDITDRKSSKISLRELSGRLIHAQEEERTRIARELHDNLSQRMALLNVGLEQLEQSMGALSSASRQQLRGIAEISEEVSSIIHNLSHQLHPSKLDTLGLVTSLAGLCREFSAQYHLQARFLHSDFPKGIPNDVTLCLFRIAQEALRNVVKHSGAAEAQVELSRHGDEVQLYISDSGAGFDPHEAQRSAGLGLVSMRERLRLLGGQLSIESQPSQGTRIRVHVPLTICDEGIKNKPKAYNADA